MKTKLNNEKGASLILVICIFMFLSTIALAVITVSNSESLQSIRKDQDVQAEYLAISGIEIMSDYIINHTDEFLIKYNDYGNNFPLDLNIEDGSVSIEVSDVGDGLRITSIGSYINSNVTENMLIDRVDTTPNFLFPEFYTDTDVLTGYESVTVPSVDINHGDETIGNGNGTYEANDDKVINLNNESTGFNNILVRTDGQLSFTTGLSNRIVVVNNITVNGDINMLDDGKIFLYIKGNADINTEFLNANENLIIILESGASLDIDANGDFNSYIFAPSEDIVLRNGTNFKGGIISKSYTSNLGVVENHIPPTDLLSLREHIKFDETFRYEVDGYE